MSKTQMSIGLYQSNFNEMMDIRKIPNLKMTNDKAQMSNQAQNPNNKKN